MHLCGYANEYARMHMGTCVFVHLRMHAYLWMQICMQVFVTTPGRPPTRPHARTPAHPHTRVPSRPHAPTTHAHLHAGQRNGHVLLGLPRTIVAFTRSSCHAVEARALAKARRVVYEVRFARLGG